MNLKRGFWRWYLVTTDVGHNIFQRAANNLVLYTNVNKTTAFYRLFQTVRGNRIKVSPKVKRLMYMLNMFLRNIFNRQQKDAFEKLKQAGVAKEMEAAEKLILCANGRKK